MDIIRAMVARGSTRPKLLVVIDSLKDIKMKQSCIVPRHTINR